MTTHNEAASVMLQARIDLVLSAPFFGALALRLDMIPDESIKTWSTDGKTLRYNPDYTLKLSHGQRKGVFAHEVLHCANGHIWRRGQRDLKKWNVAADYAINPLVTSAGMQLPADCLSDSAYDGMSAEQIYNLLPDGGDDQQGPGDVEDPPEQGEQELEADWKIATEQAVRAGRMQGNLPEALARMVEELRRPKVDWKALLRRFVQQCAVSDYSWTTPSRRYLAQGVYLPALTPQPEMPPIVIAVDMSGSTEQAQPQFFNEVAAVFEECAPSRMHVVWIDSEVEGVDTFERGDTVKLEPRGGGGTDFRPAFDWVAEQAEQPACMIYLTDLYGSFPQEPPPYPVLWISTERDMQAPFGETVYLEPD